MPQIRFTAAKVGAIRPPVDTAQVDYRDSRYPGLILKVGRGGTKSWFFRWTKTTPGGRKPWKKLGRYPAVTYKDALTKYRAEQERLENDRPPAEIKDRIAELEAELRALRRKANLLTFEGLYDKYDRKVLVKRKNPQDHRRIFQKDPLRVWSDRPAVDITSEDVERLVDEIVDRGAPVQAGLTLTKIRALYNWAVKRKLVAANPAAAIEAPVAPRKRDRRLSEQEIVEYWKALDECEPAAADAIRLCLITGQRRAEVGGMEWKEIERTEDGRTWWNIPAARTKATRTTTVFLTPLAMKIIERQGTEGSSHVFPTRRKSKGRRQYDHITEAFGSVTRQLLDQDKIEEHATLRDLRRTFATGVAAITGGKKKLLKLTLNHAMPDVTEVYDRYEYHSELAAVWTAWSERLARILDLDLDPSTPDR